ncbi:MAG: hypothetical protein DRJ56_04390 [Thermoprotei archaeon]|nr:MAG: hypothetical protein DRJ56_04390 [Thermoprotei archaeon]
MTYDFVVDSMLGKLSRWLRVLGYSTFYDPRAADEELMRVAASTGAVLLTRDRRLLRRAGARGVRAVLVSGGDVSEVLAHLHRLLGVRLSIDLGRTRCSKCNAPLQKRAKSAVRGLVPDPVLRRYDVFLVCPRCGSVYWPGKHYRNMLEALSRARALAGAANPYLEQRR